MTSNLTLRKSEGRKSGLRLSFEEIDRKCNGKVTLEQLRKASEDNGCEWDLLDEALFKLIDTDDDGTIALKGIVQHLNSKISIFLFFILEWDKSWKGIPKNKRSSYMPPQDD